VVVPVLRAAVAFVRQPAAAWLVGRSRPGALPAAYLPPVAALMAVCSPRGVVPAGGPGIRADVPEEVRAAAGFAHRAAASAGLALPAAAPVDGRGVPEADLALPAEDLAVARLQGVEAGVPKVRWRPAGVTAAALPRGAVAVPVVAPAGALRPVAVVVQAVALVDALLQAVVAEPAAERRAAAVLAVWPRVAARAASALPSCQAVLRGRAPARA